MNSGTLATLASGFSRSIVLTHRSTRLPVNDVATRVARGELVVVLRTEMIGGESRTEVLCPDGIRGWLWTDDLVEV